MVAELVTRQQSGSPINGETPHQNYTNSSMPTNGHGQNMLNNNGAMGAGNGSNGNGNSNGSSGRSSHHRSSNQHHISDSSSPTGFLHESHSNGSLVLSGGSPMSPNSQDGFSGPFDMAAHLKRKELFTQRKQREFIPDNKKDDSYWDRRRRNNEAAKRSREKRRYNDMVLEQRVVELTKENHVLKAQLDAIKEKYNISGEHLVSVEQIMATLPTTEQVLSITKRAKFNNNGSSPSSIYPQSPSPSVPTSVIQQPMSIDSPSPPQASVLQLQPAVQQPATQSFNQHNGPMSLHTNSHHHLHHHHSPASSHNFHLAETTGRPASPVRAPIIESRSGDMYANRGGFIESSTNGVSFGGQSNGIGRYSQHMSTGGRVLGNGLNDHHSVMHFDANPTSINSQSSGSDNNLNTHDDAAVTNVLNLSRRRNSDTNSNKIDSISAGSGGNSGSLSPYEMYAGLERNGGNHIVGGAGASSTVSGDDDPCCENLPISDTNNSLPLKLRHKSHLGDKDAATALLALQHIKQEPHSRLSPPWDGEGSSDERDSGISIGAAEWGIQRKIILPSAVNIGSIGAIGGIGAAIGSFAANLSSVGVVSGLNVLGVGVNNSTNGSSNNIKEENIHLKTQIARLESEVASIKTMMTLNTRTASATAVQ